MEREIIRNRISEINTIGNANKVLMPWTYDLIHVGFAIIHAIQRKRFVCNKYVISDMPNRNKSSSLRVYHYICPDSVKTYVNLLPFKIISYTHCQNYKRAFSHLKIRLFCIHFLLTWTQITTIESAKSNLNIVIFRPRMLLNL